VRKIFKRFTLSVFILAIFIIPFIQTFLSECREITVPKTVRVADYTQVPVDSDHPLTISDVSWTCQERGGGDACSLTVTGNAKNTGACTLEAIKVSVEGYDSHGNSVFNNYGQFDGSFIRSLSPGQNANWCVFCFLCPHVITEVTVGYSHDDPVHTETFSPKGQDLRSDFVFIGLFVGIWCLVWFILRLLVKRH